ncbi:uncharacterized protein N7515_000042 [Penicillium bovifimosum]|uniref:PLC-like phosphodiesterase n=1 Tax=Penicillium bovifimosum TaxID=126998 RepID=A0A9W9LB64_9EURO|nr:uncharacterized protein N7515_000042 [Penicillium bovifimosum]KAJ5145478.1 hypothetical protein N7515_000042 [Penicillium bovifimosum]
MRWSTFALLAAVAVAQDTTTTTESSTTESSTTESSTTESTTVKSVTTPVAPPSGTYLEVSTTITLGDGETSVVAAPTEHNGTMPASNQTTFTTTSDSLTFLVGGGRTSVIGNGTMNATATATSTATKTPIVNTQPCNNYPEFCGRKYSNITMIAAHNSPFVRPNNLGANQALDVTQQLNDGVRMLQFQTHYVNGTIYLCHTTCDLLNAGTLEAYLSDVNKWMRKNPYDVVSFIIGNFDFVKPENFTIPIMNSGLKDLIYSPPKAPMALDDWPTLSEMILKHKRAVFFMDYEANQTSHPWLMDEFSQVWETPFSPTDLTFPCTQQRPPGLSKKDAKKRMYMANHNLNLELNLGPLNILIPNMAQLSVTNGVNGSGSLGAMAENCTGEWQRPPNFLLVDYYNYGRPNGTVFEVAAKMNNVTYNRKCCGMESGALREASVGMSMVLLVVVGVQMLMSVF